jgi:hypothetical protein
MDEIMVMEQSTDYTSAEAINARAKMSTAARSGNAWDTANARAACGKWMETHEAEAMQIIDKRIAARAARAAHEATPEYQAEIDRIARL